MRIDATLDDEDNVVSTHVVVANEKNVACARDDVLMNESNFDFEDENLVSKDEREKVVVSEFVLAKL